MPPYRDENERFWEKVEKTKTCWLWRAGLAAPGYGRFGRKYEKERNVGRVVLAHRFAYEQIRGAIPEGMVLDHLCGNKACVNPDHLEAVTSSTNAWRAHSPVSPWYRGTKPPVSRQRSMCYAGHLLTPDNTRIVNGGKGRRCAICARERAAEFRNRWRTQTGRPERTAT